MSLQDIHSLDGVSIVGHFDGIGGINDHFSEKIRIGANQFGAHRSFGGINQTLIAQSVNFHRQMLVDVLHGLFARQS